MARAQVTDGNPGGGGGTRAGVGLQVQAAGQVARVAGGLEIGHRELKIGHRGLDIGHKGLDIAQRSESRSQVVWK